MHQGDRKARIWQGGEFAAGTERVAENFRQKLPRERLSYPWLKKLKLSPETRQPRPCASSRGHLARSRRVSHLCSHVLRHRLPVGVHFLKGFFNESLPGPVTSLAMLRADGDLYTSIYETLAALYPRLSVGGYVIFDDWPIAQVGRSHAATSHARERGVARLCTTLRLPPPVAGPTGCLPLPPATWHHHTHCVRRPDVGAALPRRASALVLEEGRDNGLIGARGGGLEVWRVGKANSPSGRLHITTHAFLTQIRSVQPAIFNTRTCNK